MTKHKRIAPLKPFMNSGVQCYEGVYYSLTDQIEEFMIHANPYDPDIAYEFEAYLETLEYK